MGVKSYGGRCLDFKGWDGSWPGEREGIGMQWMSMKCGGLVGIYMVLWKGWKEQYNAKKRAARGKRGLLLLLLSCLL